MRTASEIVGTVNGYRWEVDAALSPQLLAPLMESFPHLDRLPGVSILKSNHFRTVFRAPPQLLGPSRGERAPEALSPFLGGGLVAKVYRYTNLWDRLRYRLLPHRARQEWHALKRFQATGLPSAYRLAVAERCSGGTITGGGLILSCLADSESLAERLHFLFSRAREPGSSSLQDGAVSGDARALLLRTGKLVRKMHDSGVWHRDLHSSNILFKRVDETLHFIDLHSCRFPWKLRRWQRRQGFIKLLHSLRNTVPPEGLRILLEAYGGDALFWRGTVSRTEACLLRRVEALDRKRIRSRSKRCFLPSTLFQVHREKRARVYHLRQWPIEELASLWNQSLHGQRLKSAPDGWVALTEAGGRPVCVKHRRHGLLESIQSLFESHRLRRAYGGGHALRVRHIPTPQVVALREERLLGMVRQAYLVTELVEEGVPLGELLMEEYWGKRPGPEASRRKHLLARAVGGFIRSIHDQGLCLHDLSPQNLVVSRRALREAEAHASQEDPSFLYLVDLDHLYLWKPLFRRVRLRNLIQISNLPQGHITAADRLRGLKAYSRGEERFLEPSLIRLLHAGILKEHLKTLISRSL